MRPASGRRARLSLAVLCLAAVAVAHVSAQTGSDRPAKYSRLQRLEQWTAALERHQPGVADAALDTFNDWTPADFGTLKLTVYSALQLVRDPKIRTFFRPPLPNGRPSPQFFYSRDEMRDLLDVAKRLRP